MFIKVDSSNAGGGHILSIRCPKCRQLGTFDALHNVTDATISSMYYAGQRRCPNPECRTLVFFISQSGRTLLTFPAERIDFDTTNIPSPVVASLEEAITCHADGCFVAGAIMVRKTLEELCRDRGAQGPNLKERIKALGTRVVIPIELLEGLDDLRLLGNDAAHIESQVYDKVGKDEVEVGIEFAKEVLKAVYQYSTLLSRLRGLKKNP